MDLYILFNSSPSVSFRWNLSHFVLSGRAKSQSDPSIYHSYFQQGIWHSAACNWSNFSLASSCQGMRGGWDMWTVITFRWDSGVMGRSTPLRQLLACTLQIAVCPSELLVTTNAHNVPPHSNVSCISNSYVSLKTDRWSVFFIYENSVIIPNSMKAKYVPYREES
jgi:hypothetical protein